MGVTNKFRYARSKNPNPLYNRLECEPFLLLMLGEEHLHLKDVSVLLLIEPQELELSSVHQTTS
jgi:hypothetical protein